MSEEGKDGQLSFCKDPAEPLPMPVAGEVCAGKGNAIHGGGRRWKANFWLWSMIIIGSTETWSSGCMTAFPSVLAKDLMLNTSTLFGSHLILSGRQLDMINSFSILGNVIGNLAIAPIMSAAGRRPSMVLAVLFDLIGWIGVALIPNFPGILAARIIGGIGTGGLVVVATTFVIELAPSKKRGMASNMAVAGILAGQLMMMGFGYGNRYYIAAGFAVLVSITGFPMRLLLPESPAFLALKGRTEEAKKILKKFREPSVDLDAEIAIYINSAADASALGRWRRLFERSIMNSLMITMTLFFLGYFSGGIVFIANLSRILRMACSPISEDLASIVITTVQLAMSGAAILLVDQIGRKTILLLSYFMTTAALIGMTTYVYNVVSFDAMSPSNQTIYATEAANLYRGEAVVMLMENQWASSCWIPLVCLIIAQGGYGLGVISIPYLLATETFPSWIRPQACGICNCTASLSSLMSVQIFTPLLEAVTLPGLFFTYTVFCLTGFIFTWIFVKETKDKPLL